MKDIFKEVNTEVYMEKFEIIFDRAKNEKMAKSNALDFYMSLVEDEDIVLDSEEIIELAESYGYDFSDFEELINTYNE